MNSRMWAGVAPAPLFFPHTGGGHTPRHTANTETPADGREPPQISPPPASSPHARRGGPPPHKQKNHETRQSLTRPARDLLPPTFPRPPRRRLPADRRRRRHAAGVLRRVLPPGRRPAGARAARAVGDQV